jgi:hypothetical protein
MSLLVDSMVEVAFKYSKSPLETVKSKRELIEALKVAKTKGYDINNSKRSFYFGKMAGFMYHEATMITKTMSDEITRVLDLKNYKNGACDGVHSTQ